MADDGNDCKNDENAVSHNDLSSFSDIYKYSNRDMLFTLEKRRQNFLQKQKEKRSEAFDEKRDLSQLFDETEAEPMEHESLSVRKKQKKNPFRYRLMGSEWFTEVPEDFNENWLVKLCPEGVRYLVVAHQAITTCYYRNGKRAMRFKSNLPGGNNNIPHKFTVLDCIYNAAINTIFVYDVLAWNSVSLLNAEAHMRFMWLKSKFEENPEMCEISQSKKFFFSLMDFFPADKSLLQDKLFISLAINDCEIPYDGVLFYHCQGHYSFHRSPLVGWLKTFMIPEVLQIDVHPSHLRQKPENYESVQQYLSVKKRKKKVDDSVEMDEIEEHMDDL